MPAPLAAMLLCMVVLLRIQVLSESARAPPWLLAALFPVNLLSCRRAHSQPAGVHTVSLPGVHTVSLQGCTQSACSVTHEVLQVRSKAVGVTKSGAVIMVQWEAPCLQGNDLDVAGRGMAGQSREGQGRAGQGRAARGRARQGRAGLGGDGAGQGRAGQGRAGQGKARLTSRWWCAESVSSNIANWPKIAQQGTQVESTNNFLGPKSVGPSWRLNALLTSDQCNDIIRHVHATDD